jgi:hypothetical protein
VGHEQRRARVVSQVPVKLDAGVDPRAGVERGERLVEQQQRGGDGEGAGQCDALCLPA